jgi:hypothetical protein
MQTSALWRTLSAMLLVSSFWCSPARGQWLVTAQVGADRFWGGSRENTAERRSFRPYRPTTIGGGIERQQGRVGIGLRLRYTEASLGLEGEDAVVAVKGVFTMVSVLPEIGYQLATIGGDNHVVIQAGPLFEIWGVIDQESRTRVGVQGAVSLRIPLGKKLAASFAAGVAVTPSPFIQDELDSSYDLRPLWRRGFAAGLQYRL